LSAGCEVIKHLNDIPEISQYKKPEKVAAIEKYYYMLNGKDHPVRIAMFNMDTIEEIAIIESKRK
jgi:hypothetical protein